jgi:hypothetical protein
MDTGDREVEASSEMIAQIGIFPEIKESDLPFKKGRSPRSKFTLIER